MFGLAGAYDTLGSQAYGGGNQVRPLHLLLSSTESVQEARVLETLSLRLSPLANNMTRQQKAEHLCTSSCARAEALQHGWSSSC